MVTVVNGDEVALFFSVMMDVFRSWTYDGVGFLLDIAFFDHQERGFKL